MSIVPKALLCGNRLSTPSWRCQALRKGFTLLEVMLAVAIIGLIAASIFRFVDSTLRVVQTISQNGAGYEDIEALCRVLQSQLNELPFSQQEALLGQPHIFNGIPSDEIQWKCSSGNALFTAYAPGEYQVTLRVQSIKKSNGEANAAGSELGIRRVLLRGNPEEFHWVSLIPGIKAMEIRYFQEKLNKWVEKWTEPQARPNLVRLSFWRDQWANPYEVVLTVPRTDPQQGGAGAPLPPRGGLNQ